LQTEAETKGLWVLARSIDNLTVLLIDSEGIDAPGLKSKTRFFPVFVFFVVVRVDWLFSFLLLLL
jgi:hypothetical protein